MDRFDIEEEPFAGGASGRVYNTRIRDSNKSVVIKKIPIPRNILSPRNVREISLLLELKHPNIVQLLEPVAVMEEQLCLVFECFGWDLQEHMQTKPERYPTLRKSFLQQMLEAVAFCHSKDVIHRDLKPANILVDTNANPPVVKVADFGLARGFITEASLSPEVVTFGYRAPELHLGAPYSTPIDIWSVGCIFFEMVTMKNLIPANCESEEMNRIFSIMGTPTEEIWPGVAELPLYSSDFRRYAPQDLETMVSDLEPAENADFRPQPKNNCAECTWPCLFSGPMIVLKL
ncbi:hypothetical protein AQUCO_01500441v1 [Aquilegia coerulea]|uniref:Protein kinase domain-containing protein n=1 Tax=Aquilegia coerulea TaxID=218851 RepID=A0A2G5DTP9_AQUCA|nr:hypothetical protein AQUCO_01500441v1 [Aquilegia coerulea]